MMRIIRPKTSVDVGVSQVFFLAGPVKGGDDWQAKMCRELEKRIHPEREFFVVVPCPSWDKNHRLAAFFCEDDSKITFERQLDWERYYIPRAGSKNPSEEPGCLVFWLPEESKENPRKGKGPYARDTYGELGACRVLKSLYPAINLVVGAEEGFPGLDVFQRNISADLKKEFLIRKTFADTAQIAVETAFCGYAAKSPTEEKAARQMQVDECTRENVEMNRRLLEERTKRTSTRIIKPSLDVDYVHQ